MQAKSFGKIKRSTFEAPKWAKNRHIQTIFPRFFQKRKRFTITWERLELPDNDFVDLAWGPRHANPTGLVVMFHGLEGSIRSHYANDMMATLHAEGWQTVMMHFRGCSGKPNTTTRAYHSGDTNDALFLLQKLQRDYTHLPRAAIGVSLGGNMLLKLLGENPADHGLCAAISISAPLKLAECSLSINQGFSKVYQKYLLESMKRNLKQKMRTLDYSSVLQITIDDVDHIANFHDFDNKVTAPLHGFVDAEDYYEKCSGFHFLSAIHCPTLILHAIDDPFMNHLVIPEAQDLARNVTIELSEHGGHVGFLQGTPWKPRIWLHQRVPAFLKQYLKMP
jgi:predicted alpha/beta-fold hydrolase